MNTRSELRRFLACSVSAMAVVLWSQAAHSNPAGGIVEAGSAEITTPNAGALFVNQTSHKAIVNWGSFDIGTGELTQFVLPDSTSVTLNRDFSGDPSEILGALKSNGHFYLVNPNGILFGAGSRVDVSGLVATTHDIRSSDFLAGKLDFNIAGDPSASVISRGNITIADTGIAAFVAPHVRNDGAVVARMGKVALASANGFTLDLYGDQLVSFLIENPNQQAYYGAESKPITALVENGGSIIADGGQVVLTAAAARGVVDSVINTDGIIQANSVAQRGGKIILGGGSAGAVKVAGKVSARGVNAGEKGGEIIVTGETLTAEQTAILDASGWSGGGKLLFGGDYLGGKATNADVARFHFTMEDEPIQTAAAALLMDGAQLKADALVAGDGGKVVVWSEDATVSAADISAKGGSQSGNGGFIETSGGYLQVERAADASAANGAEGTWLLDPLDITIDRASASNSLWWMNPSELWPLYFGGWLNARTFRPTGAGSVLSASVIETALNSGSNVFVTTAGTSGGATGDIRLKTNITKVAGGSAQLSLFASDDVIIDPGVSVRSFAAPLNLELSALSGSIFGTNVGQMSMNGGTLMLIARDGIQFSSAFDMPDNLLLGINNNGIGSSLKQVDVTFGQDRVRYDYNATNLELRPGAISLLDPSATGNLFIGFARAVNAHLYDLAIVGTTGRSWDIGPTVSASAVGSSALNGIPEISGYSNPTWSFGAEPGAGYTPVLEVSVLRDGTADAGKHIVTAPSGYALLNAYLTRPQPLSPVQQVVMQATNPNINLQAALNGIAQQPGLSCQLGAAQCVALTGATPTPSQYTSAPLLSSNTSMRTSQTSKLAQIYLAQAFQTGPYAGYLAPSTTTPSLIKECVSLTKAVAGVGATSTWTPGKALKPDSSGNYPDIPSGTPLATFDPATTPGSYNGSTGKTTAGQWQHTGIFLGYITDSAGAIVGMSMLDQYQISGSKPAGVSEYYFGDTTSFLKNASNYSVVQ